MIRSLPAVGRDSFHGAHRVTHDVIPKPVDISCRRSREQRRFGNLLGRASGRTHFAGSYLDAPPRGIPACTETPVRETGPVQGRFTDLERGLSAGSIDWYPAARDQTVEELKQSTGIDDLDDGDVAGHTGRAR